MFQCLRKRRTEYPQSEYRKEKPVLPGHQDAAFEEFYKSARFNKILDQKTTIMIHLATALSTACEP